MTIDTFYLKITTSGGFDENSQIDFIVAENENSVPIIENTYNLNDDNEFEITLSKADAEKTLKKPHKHYILGIYAAFCVGAGDGNRTCNLIITNDLLCH